MESELNAKTTVKKHSSKRKPFEEISAIFNGNEVKIRIPKSTKKPPKLTPSQQKLHQRCDCDEDDSDCSESCGVPTMDDGAPANRFNFQIPDDICEAMRRRTALNSELTYSKKEGHEYLCDTCNVTPGDAPRGVRAHKVMHPDKDVFLLKIGKQTDEPDRTGNIEVELITPKAPAKLRPASHACQEIQCVEGEIPWSQPCRVCRSPSLRSKRSRRRC